MASSNAQKRLCANRGNGLLLLFTISEKKIIGALSFRCAVLSHLFQLHESVADHYWSAWWVDLVAKVRELHRLVCFKWLTWTQKFWSSQYKAVRKCACLCEHDASRRPLLAIFRIMNTTRGLLVLYVSPYLRSTPSLSETMIFLY